MHNLYSLFSITLPTLKIFVFLIIAILVDVRRHLIVVFICISLISDIEHFSHTYWPSVLFGKISIQILYSFFYGVFVSFLLNCIFFLLILDINSLSDIWFVNIFVLFQILPLDFVHYFICCEKLFYLCSLIYFCFVAFAFGVKSKKLLPKLILKNSLIVFSYIYLFIFIGW